MKKTIFSIAIMITSINNLLSQSITETESKVGINQTIPVSALDVNGNIQISNSILPMGLMTEVGGTTPLLNLGVNFRTPNRNYNYPLFRWLYRPGNSTNENTLMAITRDGNVGIATGYPSGKLEILKNADLSNAISLPNSGLIIRADNDGNDASLRFGVDNTNLKAVIQTQQTTTGSKFDLLINPFGGNVGIGTKNSNSWKLAVNGKIRAKEIKVEAGWSDFVFFDDYKLPSLQEVENHIKENGHLIDIPSAQEVEKNGIFLGEMDSKLLQKIEELTLYTIQQQKEIENLKKENKELRSVSDRLAKIEEFLKLKE